MELCRPEQLAVFDLVEFLRYDVLAVEMGRIRVGPLEAIDGTPVIDLKPVLRTDGD